jgi:hypothetical protein
MDDPYSHVYVHRIDVDISTENRYHMYDIENRYQMYNFENFLLYFTCDYTVFIN